MATVTGDDETVRAPVDRGDRIPNRIRLLVLAVLSLAFFAVGLHQAGRDAPTVDEGVDVSSGVSVLVRHDLRMVPEHPVLPRAVAALPALLAGVPVSRGLVHTALLGIAAFVLYAIFGVIVLRTDWPLAISGLLILAGVRAGYADLAILAYRIASYWLPLLAGPPAYLLFRHRYGRPTPRRATPGEAGSTA